MYELLESPVLYRALQIPFARRKFRPVLVHNDLTRVRRVLDIGCGPGTNASFFEHTDYLGLDMNPRYVDFASRRYRGAFMVGDATRLTLSEQFDFVLINSVLHHLTDADAERVVAAVPELLTPDGTVHILDLIRPEGPSPSRLLARLDRGHFARPEETWIQLFSRHFQPLVTYVYSVGVGPVHLWRLIYFKGRRA